MGLITLKTIIYVLFRGDGIKAENNGIRRNKRGFVLFRFIPSYSVARNKYIYIIINYLRLIFRIIGLTTPFYSKKR